MSKYYIAPTRKGRMLKIVEDVRVPVSDKLQKLGVMEYAYIVKQRLVARFVNEEECKLWLEAYRDYTEEDFDPHSIQPFKFKQKVRVWDFDGEMKYDALFFGMTMDAVYPYEVLCNGKNFTSRWKHCEPYEW